MTALGLIQRLNNVDPSAVVVAYDEYGELSEIPDDCFEAITDQTHYLMADSCRNEHIGNVLLIVTE